MSVIASTIPTGPVLPASIGLTCQVWALRIALKTLGPPPKGFLLFTDCDQHRRISMVGEREDRVDLDYDPETLIVAVTRPIGWGGADINDPDFERKLKAQLVNLKPWAPRRPKLPLPELILLDVLGLLLAGPWRNLSISCYIHPTSPTTAWEVSPEGDYASVALAGAPCSYPANAGTPGTASIGRSNGGPRGGRTGYAAAAPTSPSRQARQSDDHPNPVTPGWNAS